MGLTIPDKVKIGGIVYDVKFVDAGQVSKDDWNMKGCIIYSKQEIRILKGMAQEYTNEVFLHELLHGIFDHCGFEQDDNVVDRLAMCMYQVLKDNKLNF